MQSAQKAYIDVHEEGTEAVATTTINIVQGRVYERVYAITYRVQGGKSPLITLLFS